MGLSHFLIDFQILTFDYLVQSEMYSQRKNFKIKTAKDDPNR